MRVRLTRRIPVLYRRAERELSDLVWSSDLIAGMTVDLGKKIRRPIVDDTRLRVDVTMLKVVGHDRQLFTPSSLLEGKPYVVCEEE